MEAEVRAGVTVAASAENVQVASDREAGEPKPVLEAWRAAIEADVGL